MPTARKSGDAAAPTSPSGRVGAPLEADCMAVVMRQEMLTVEHLTRWLSIPYACGAGWDPATMMG